MESLEKGKLYTIEWVDGEFETGCVFVRKYRGFLIFVNEDKDKIVCRPESVHSITLS